tara:strand:- start:23638 stop:24384 length:747 start_codon:yes stop_codon:yes gene_type:complete
MLRKDLNDYLNQLLNPTQFKDYCPNGLQVQGKTDINTIATAVTASLNVIEQAIAIKADALIVHHGYFWKGEDACITGMKHKRIKALLAHDINLFAYHLPLDAHPALGNNVRLAKQLDLTLNELTGEQNILAVGELTKPQSLEQFGGHVAKKLKREPHFISGHSRDIKTISWCTGAAQDSIEQAAALGVDAYLSGEVSERTYHQAKELGIHYIAAGHHATERYGIQALGEHLANEFNFQNQFLDEPNLI